MSPFRVVHISKMSLVAAAMGLSIMAGLIGSLVFASETTAQVVTTTVAPPTTAATTVPPTTQPVPVETTPPETFPPETFPPETAPPQTVPPRTSPPATYETIPETTIETTTSSTTVAPTTTEEGETTSTITPPATASSTGNGPSAAELVDPAQERLQTLSQGLIVLAVLISIATFVFWKFTRPPRVADLPTVVSAESSAL